MKSKSKGLMDMIIWGRLGDLKKWTFPELGWSLDPLTPPPHGYVQRDSFCFLNNQRSYRICLHAFIRECAGKMVKIGH